MNNYKNIIQIAMDGFWLLDANGKILEVNDAACKLSGYTQAEMVGMSITDLEAKEVASETAKHIQEIIKKGSDRFESRHKTKNGQVVDVEVSVNFDPDSQQFFSFIRDISDRKQQQEEKLKLQALEEFKQITEGREMKMVELKAKIKELESQLAAQNHGQ